ncbi:putative 2-ketogluconate transporter [Aspergillus novofumigatus IBT 16806]|uniref:Allantoate permease n=1 Tax=Aspergillus novofumigatus (strain IBT 16806) TaxID=1392255 RepID=A0A2I1C762_ASPN1|nr:allantoate permease [Aspergillus novofumigatus IBT 16806]PKX93453.1 allantoate permease [Aspergillus novofumigatus IBT 16806]
MAEKLALSPVTSSSPEAGDDRKQPKDINHVERVLSDGLIKDEADYSRMDRDLQEYVARGQVDVDEATSKRLKRMIDRRVLIIMIFTYFLQALDKGTLSFASIMGIRTDLHLQNGQKYSWLTTCIYIAVLVVEYPTNWIIQRVPIAKYLGINICLWGTVLALHAVSKNFTHMVVLRTLLGIFEACCQPTFVLLSSMWYKRDEQAATVTYWYMMNGGQQIVGGLLAYCFSLIGKDKAIHSWQALFITYGVISVIWGLFVIFWMPDSPMRAKCFSEEDKHLMVERVRANQTGMQNKKFRAYQMWEAFRDPQMYCYCAIQIFTTLPTSGLGAFANIIISGFKFTVLQTQLLAMVLGFYIIIVLLSSAWLVKKTGQNLLVMLAFVIPSYVGTIVLMTVVNKNMATKVGLLISYYITLSFWSAQTLCLSMVSRNIAGATKKSTVVAATFVSWAVGNSIGKRPRYFIAFGVHLGCYVCLTLAIIFLRFWLVLQNKRKARVLEEKGLSAADNNLTHAFEDRTDQENLHFRYIY